MKLYVGPISPNSRRVEAAVHHLGLTDRVMIERVDFSSGQLQSAPFLAVNPNGKLPALEDGATKLWESNAILHALAVAAGDDSFLPNDNAGRIEILRWQFWECQHFNKAVSTITWETLVKPHFGLGTTDEATVTAATVEFRRFAQVLEAHLDGRRFLLGDKVTVADFAVGAYSALVPLPQTRVPIGDYPQISAWYAALEAIPGWAATAPPPGLFDGRG